jgi:hypothetical protein
MRYSIVCKVVLLIFQPSFVKLLLRDLTVIQGCQSAHFNSKVSRSKALGIAEASAGLIRKG